MTDNLIIKKDNFLKQQRNARDESGKKQRQMGKQPMVVTTDENSC